jgi:hypothetical protein
MVALTAFQESSLLDPPYSLKMHSFLRILSVHMVGLALVNAIPSVTISAGTIHGATCSNGPSAFLSIPYAKPPTGNLRWTAPQAYSQTFPTSGFNASTKGAACIQFGTQFLETGTTSEDWSVFSYPITCHWSLLTI